MDVYWIANGVPEGSQPSELETLLRRDDGFVWVDIVLGFMSLIVLGMVRWARKKGYW